MSIRFKPPSILLFLVVLLVLVLLSNRSGNEKEDPVPASAVSESVSDDRLSSEQHLSERIEARWAALVEGNVAKAYEYETPGFRQAVELDDYQKLYGTATRWSGAEISKVEFASEGSVATVHLMVAYEVTLPDGNQYLGRRLMKERWLFKEGDWWFVQQ